MKQKDRNILEFNAIPMWEVIVSFFVMLFLVYGISEYVILRITTNTTMHTQFIIVLMALVLVVFYNFYKYRSKKIFFQQIDNEVKVILGNKNLLLTRDKFTLITFFHKKFRSHMLRVDNLLFVISEEYDDSSKKKEDLYGLRLNKLKEIIHVKKKYTWLDYIPISINILFYLLIIVAFSLFAFMMIAIVTDNTQWFEYYKNLNNE